MNIFLAKLIGYGGSLGGGEEAEIFHLPADAVARYRVVSFTAAGEQK
jgi:hypothetical protein